MAPLPANRWTRALKRRPSTFSALAMFTLFVTGSILVIVSSFAGLAGLLLALGALGSGWGGRLGGIGLVVAAIVGFFVGKWATDQYSVQRRS